MKKFLNRMLGLHVDAQDVLIAMMLDILDQVGVRASKLSLYNKNNASILLEFALCALSRQAIENDKAQGKYDKGSQKLTRCLPEHD